MTRRSQGHLQLVIFMTNLPLCSHVAVQSVLGGVTQRLYFSLLPGNETHELAVVRLLLLLSLLLHIHLLGFPIPRGP